MERCGAGDRRTAFLYCADACGHGSGRHPAALPSLDSSAERMRDASFGLHRRRTPAPTLPTRRFPEKGLVPNWPKLSAILITPPLEGPSIQSLFSIGGPPFPIGTSWSAGGLANKRWSHSAKTGVAREAGSTNRRLISLWFRSAQTCNPRTSTGEPAFFSALLRARACAVPSARWRIQRA